MLIFEFRILFYWEFRILLGTGGGGVCAERGVTQELSGEQM